MRVLRRFFQWRSRAPYVVVLGLSLAIVSGASANGIWSAKGIVPSLTESGRDDIAAPDGRHNISATAQGLRLVDASSGVSFALPSRALPPLWEVSWSEDSRHVAINASDGGAVGTWDATIYTLQRSGMPRRLAVSDIIRRAASSFAKCYEHEDVNVAFVGWDKDPEVAMLVAEVPPHSSCKNMGQLRGYRLSLASEKIVGIVTESVLMKSNKLGAKFAPD